MDDSAVNPHEIRPSALAGTWYPGTRRALRQEVEGMLQRATRAELGGPICGIIVPHAGLMYSGQVAAEGYKQLEGREFRTVVLLGPSHRAYFQGILVSDKSYYETPLGLVPVDLDAVSRIAETLKVNYLPQDLEHSLEIQLPFLQTVLPDFRIVPLMLGDQSFAFSEALATLIARIFADSNSILIASSDLSHFHTYEEAVLLDRRFLAEVEAFDPAGVQRAVTEGEAEACGAGAVISVMLATQRMGANRARVLKYANSGDVSGDRSRVVGYSAVAISKTV